MTSPVIIETGAALGIGRAISNTLLVNNAHAFLADLKDAELKKKKEHLQKRTSERAKMAYWTLPATIVFKLQMRLPQKIAVCS